MSLDISVYFRGTELCECVVTSGNPEESVRKCFTVIFVCAKMSCVFVYVCSEVLSVCHIFLFQTLNPKWNGQCSIRRNTILTILKAQVFYNKLFSSQKDSHLYVRTTNVRTLSTLVDARLKNMSRKMQQRRPVTRCYETFFQFFLIVL